MTIEAFVRDDLRIVNPWYGCVFTLYKSQKKFAKGCAFILQGKQS